MGKTTLIHIKSKCLPVAVAVTVAVGVAVVVVVVVVMLRAMFSLFNNH